MQGWFSLVAFSFLKSGYITLTLSAPVRNEMNGVLSKLKLSSTLCCKRESFICTQVYTRGPLKSCLTMKSRKRSLLWWNTPSKLKQSSDSSHWNPDTTCGAPILSHGLQGRTLEVSRSCHCTNEEHCLSRVTLGQAWVAWKGHVRQVRWLVHKPQWQVPLQAPPRLSLVLGALPGQVHNNIDWAMYEFTVYNEMAHQYSEASNCLWQRWLSCLI
jgi:hypothetical protein